MPTMNDDRQLQRDTQVKPSRLPTFNAAPPAKAPSPASTAPRAASSLPRPANSSNSAGSSSKDADGQLRSSNDFAQSRLHNKARSPSPGLLDDKPKGLNVPRLNLHSVGSSSEGAKSHALKEPEVCPSPCRRRASDITGDAETGAAWLASTKPVTPLPVQQSLPARARPQSPLPGRTSASNLPRPSLDSKPTAPSPSKTPGIVKAAILDTDISPDAVPRKALNAAGKDGAPRAASTGKGGAARATSVPAETRASQLRRSTSVDKRYGQNYAAGAGGAYAARKATADAIGVSPQPPAAPQDAAGGRGGAAAARHRVVGSPKQRRTSLGSVSVAAAAAGAAAAPTPAATKTTGVRGASPSPDPSFKTPYSRAQGKPSLLDNLPDRLGKTPGTGEPALARIAEQGPGHPTPPKSSQPLRSSAPMGSVKVGSLGGVTKLDLSSLTRHSVELPVRPTSAPSDSPAVSIPKLNLAPVIEQQTAENSCGAVYVNPPDPVPNNANSNAKKKEGGRSAGSKKASPPSPPPDHYYFYPKVDGDAEKKTLEIIDRLHPSARKILRKVFNESVQAKQNCEAIFFRGHRLLDQMTHHHKEHKQRTEEQIDTLTAELEDKLALLNYKDREALEFRLKIERQQQRIARQQAQFERCRSELRAVKQLLLDQGIPLPEGVSDHTFMEGDEEGDMCEGDGPRSEMVYDHHMGSYGDMRAQSEYTGGEYINDNESCSTEYTSRAHAIFNELQQQLGTVIPPYLANGIPDSTDIPAHHSPTRTNSYAASPSAPALPHTVSGSAAFPSGGVGTSAAFAPRGAGALADDDDSSGARLPFALTPSLAPVAAASPAIAAESGSGHGGSSARRGLMSRLQAASASVSLSAALASEALLPHPPPLCNGDGQAEKDQALLRERRKQARMLRAAAADVAPEQDAL